jgi:signal recognition particle receptor subunit beta
MEDLLRSLHGLIPPALAQLAPPEVIVAVLLVLITTLVIILGTRLVGKGKRGTQVVLAGPCNGGKTTLFLQLRYGSATAPTVASMAENEAACAFTDDRGRSTAPVKVVDVPGHHSSKHRLERQLGDALAVVFVVDAVDISPHKVEAAELLYEVLFQSPVAARRAPVLIACNKMDLEDQAHSVEFIRRTLEKQLETMRKTKTARIGQDLAKHGAGGGAEKIFSFAGLKNRVVFGSISALKADIKELHSFVAPLV